MNSLEKRSFYSFLALYLISSGFFVLLSGFLYFNAQKNSLNSTTYYKLQHIADKISGLIIHAHMSNTKLTISGIEDGYSYMLIPTNDHISYDHKYFEEDGFKILASPSPQKHLNIEFVVVKTDEYHKNLGKIKIDIFYIMAIVFIAIVVISYFLSKLFMKPIHQKVTQIEQFIQDVSHELNTPITALNISSKRAMQKEVYDQKILTNISISTKQLYGIYKSLAYLNFNSPQQEIEELQLKSIIEDAIDYYAELSRIKNITIKSDLKESILKIAKSDAELLFSNLISNAIKYSMPKTTITIILKDNFFSIEDQGIGIAKDKIETIFNIYERGSSLAGGFGIGLSIVKKICTEYNISIEAVSQLNIGSCFTLRWN